MVAGKTVDTGKVDALVYLDKDGLTERATTSDESVVVKLRYKQPQAETSTLMTYPAKDTGGAFGVAAEIGHLCLVPEGRICGCGNRGCFEQYASGTALVREMEGRLAGSARLIVVETAGRPDYRPTRAFYEARGYRRAAVIPDFYAPGDDQVVYVKTLSTG